MYESKIYMEEMFEEDDFFLDCLVSFDENISLIEAGNTSHYRPN